MLLHSGQKSRWDRGCVGKRSLLVRGQRGRAEDTGESQHLPPRNMHQRMHHVPICISEGLRRFLPPLEIMILGTKPQQEIGWGQNIQVMAVSLFKSVVNTSWPVVGTKMSVDNTGKGRCGFVNISHTVCSFLISDPFLWRSEVYMW